MTTIKVDSSELHRLAGDMAAVTPKMHAAVREVVRTHGFLLLLAVRRNASLPRTAPRGPGTGGPRLITGSYLRTINVRFDGSGHHAAATVSTNAPEARRLEMGYIGTDALGRTVHAPPYAHFRPAEAEILPRFEAALRAAVVEAFG